jgi:ribosomal protein S18 acetylase RimI-like enzyme
VLASHHRLGIGRALFAAAASDWKRREGAKLYVRVLTANRAAIAFYEAMGCRQCADATCSIAGVDLPEGVLVLDLSQPD